MEGLAGATFCIYWGEVSDDSDGPVEWCRPVPNDQATTLAAALPELRLRSEPAHREAFVHLGPGGETSPAQWKLVSESLRVWAMEHAVKPIELGARITYIASAPVTETSAPECDFAVPIS